MRKYDIPKIEIVYFLSEIFLASSALPQRAYINEVDVMEAAFSGADQQKRMESFTELLTFN